MALVARIGGRQRLDIVESLAVLRQAGGGVSQLRGCFAEPGVADPQVPAVHGIGSVEGTERFGAFESHTAASEGGRIISNAGFYTSDEQRANHHGAPIAAVGWVPLVQGFVDGSRVMLDLQG